MTAVVSDWAVPAEVTVPVDPAAVLVLELVLELEDPHEASARTVAAAAIRYAADLLSPLGGLRSLERAGWQVDGGTWPEYLAESSGRR